MECLQDQNCVLQGAVLHYSRLIKHLVINIIYIFFLSFIPIVSIPINFTFYMLYRAIWYSLKIAVAIVLTLLLVKMIGSMV